MAEDRQRIDKWLWHARVVRTRSAAAALGALADVKGIDFVFQLTSYLPLLGVLTVFLPSFEKRQVAA